MAQTNWAYVGSSDFATGSGPTGSVQFHGVGTSLTGSYNFMYHTASLGELAASTLVLTGTLVVTGTISASHYHIKDVTRIDSTGSTYFGDTFDDVHVRTGSLLITSSYDNPSSFMGPYVGIGTLSPSKLLHLYGSSGEVELRIQSDTSYTSIVQKDNAELIIQNAATDGVIIFHDDTAERMRIASDGNVGIGTNNPTYTLTVAGTISASSGLTGSAFLTDGAISAGGYLIVSGAASGVPTGRVGIGTVNPSGALHIQTGEAGVAAAGLADDLVIESDGDTGISLLSPGTSGDFNSLYMGVPGRTNAGLVQYYHDNTLLTVGTNVAAGKLALATAAALNAVIIDENQNVSASAGYLIVSGAASGVPTHRVGIGTVNPSGSLHIASGSSGGAAHSYADDLVIESNDDAGITLLTPGGGGNYNTIYMGVPGTPNAAGMQYYHSNTSFTAGTIITGGTTNLVSGLAVTALTLDENQNVTASGDLHVAKIIYAANVTASLNMSASLNISASAFYGDGSTLTGIDAFPFTGEAAITGSLVITGSDSSTLLTLKTDSISDVLVISDTLLSSSLSSSALVHVGEKLQIGTSCVASGLFSTVAGGAQNEATNNYAVVAGGYDSTATATYTFVGSGLQNNAAASYASVVGGNGNDTAAQGSFIGGGSSNDISAAGADGVLVGGSTNKLQNSKAFIGAGERNTNRGQYSAIVGGIDNVIGAASYSFIGAGQECTASAFWTTVVGGYQNKSTAHYASVLGGLNNTASGQRSVILGSSGSIVSGKDSFAIGSDLTITEARRAVIGSSVAGYGVALSGSTTVHGTTHLSGGVRFRRYYVTGAYSASASDYFLGVDTASEAISISLDATLFADGQTLVIKDENGNANANNITLTASSAQKIDVNYRSVTIESSFGAINLYTDSNNWFVY